MSVEPFQITSFTMETKIKFESFVFENVSSVNHNYGFYASTM